MLLVYKLEGLLEISNSSVLGPLFALWILAMFNSCRVKWCPEHVVGENNPS